MCGRQSVPHFSPICLSCVAWYRWQLDQWAKRHLGVGWDNLHPQKQQSLKDRFSKLYYGIKPDKILEQSRGIDWSSMKMNLDTWRDIFFLIRKEFSLTDCPACGAQALFIIEEGFIYPYFKVSVPATFKDFVIIPDSEPPEPPKIEEPDFFQIDVADPLIHRHNGNNCLILQGHHPPGTPRYYGHEQKPYPPKPKEQPVEQPKSFDDVIKDILRNTMMEGE